MGYGSSALNGRRLHQICVVQVRRVLDWVIVWRELEDVVLLLHTCIDIDLLFCVLVLITSVGVANAKYNRCWCSRDSVAIFKRSAVPNEDASFF